MTSIISSKKYIFLLLMSLLPLCYILMKRYDVYVPTMNFSDQRIFSNTTDGALTLSNSYGIHVADPGHEQLKQTVTNSDKPLTILNLSNINEISANLIDVQNIFVWLKDISKSTRNIFFIESRCATEKLSREASSTTVCLNPRQSCAVLSTAAANPSRIVYVLLTCPVGDDFLVQSPEYVRSLLRHPNVRLVRYNMTDMFKDTPVEGLVARKGMEESSYPVEHASDVLRLTMLWKYGGSYCDMDIVAIRSFDDLKTNFCGLESDDFIGSAVLNFEPRGVGHELLTKALHHVNDHFDGSRWMANGPDVVTNIVMEACNATFENITSCTSFSVFNHNVFYPIFWWDHAMLFDSTVGPKIVEYIKKSSYIVHVWNKQSHPNKVVVGSTQAYGLLANGFCPSIYRNCGEYF